MPKLKYYTDAQRQEGKQIAMLEYQEKKREQVIKSMGGKCFTCEQCDPATLILATPLQCGSCRQKERYNEARKRLASRKAALEQCRIESWTKSTNPLKEETYEHRTTDQTPSTNQE